MYLYRNEKLNHGTSFKNIFVGTRFTFYKLFLSFSKMDVEVACDVSFNTVNPDVIVTAGKEHLVWWKVYPETGSIQVLQRADYQVIKLI